jgi:hypothetical protein
MPIYNIYKFLLCKDWLLASQAHAIDRYRPHNRNCRLYVEVFSRMDCGWVFYDAAQDWKQGTTFAEFVVTFYSIREDNRHGTE